MTVSKRRDLETQLHSLTEIKEIMNAMKNLSLMEVHRLSRFLDTQRRVVASIEAAAADFLHFHPELLAGEEEFRNVYLLVGSERGFCGDFNEALLRALDNHIGSARDVKLVAIGSKLVAKLSDDPRVGASLDGASVVEEVDSVLVKLMDTLTGLSAPGAARAPLRLTVFHHDAAEETIKVSDLRPFQKPEAKTIRFTHAPLLNLQPQSFFAGLADQYLFAALHELLYSSLMAENQRRMQHMDAAVRRLERTSTELLQKRNILRQEEITEEIEVIMLSVEALE
jgi:F-type H+-transporting ATPase subunit gamma